MKEFNLSKKQRDGDWMYGLSNTSQKCYAEEDIKEFIKGLNEDIFTEGFWNYIWINYFNNDDEEIFVKMMTHFRKRYEEKINELVGDKLR